LVGFFDQPVFFLAFDFVIFGNEYLNQPFKVFDGELRLLHSFSCHLCFSSLNVFVFLASSSWDIGLFDHPDGFLFLTRGIFFSCLDVGHSLGFPQLGGIWLFFECAFRFIPTGENPYDGTPLVLLCLTTQSSSLSPSSGFFSLHLKKGP